MMINYDWYTTNYWHMAVYATLRGMVIVDSKPFDFDLKKLVDFFFKNF